MAPGNGASGKPAKTSARRATSNTVVPVLPLNYPQRPVNRQISVPAKSSPLAEVQPRQQVAEKQQSDAKSSDNSTNNHSNGVSVESLDSLGPTPPEEAKPVDEPTPIPAPRTVAPASTDSTAAPTPPTGASAGMTLLSYPHFPAVIPCRAPLCPHSPPQPLLSTRKSSSHQGLDTPTVVAAPLSRSVASPTPTRPSGTQPSSTNSPSLHGPVHDQPTLAPQPALAFRPGFHQAHPSNGSMIFGGFQDSNASSPAPHSGGGFPPPDMMHYPPVAPVDAYGRPLLVSPTLDGYPPAVINHHGPPTPHSFHGSQASAQAEDHSHGLRPAVNGVNGHPRTEVSQPTALPVMNSHVNGSMQASTGTSTAALQTAVRDQEEDALNFLRSAIDEPIYSDVVLEVVCMDLAHNPALYHPDFHALRHVIRVPAHRLILSRSRTLTAMLSSHPGAQGNVIRIELQGKHMRPDVFFTAIRSLYGWPLADNQVFPTDLFLRDVRDDFNLALSYITVGQYLELRWVYAIAMHRASQLLVWDTLEQAAEFVLPTNISARARHDPYGTMNLLGHILGFIVKNFPKDFVLDVNASLSGFSRLPAVHSSQAPIPPSVVNGSSAGIHSRQLSLQSNHPRSGQRLSTNPRLSQIKFGDISPQNQNGSSAAAGHDGAQRRRAPTVHETVLSKVLLNLPYELLKQILEDHNLAGAVGGIDPAMRQSIITNIIAEREARRLRTLDRSQTHLQYLQQTAASCEAPLLVEGMSDFFVNNMGFKEEVCAGDLPFLVHTWVAQAAFGTSPDTGSAC